MFLLKAPTVKLGDAPIGCTAPASAAFLRGLAAGSILAACLASFLIMLHLLPCNTTAAKPGLPIRGGVYEVEPANSRG